MKKRFKALIACIAAIAVIASVMIIPVGTVTAAADEKQVYYSQTGYNLDTEGKDYFSSLGMDVKEVSGTAINGGDSPVATALSYTSGNQITYDEGQFFGGRLGGSEKGYSLMWWNGNSTPCSVVIDLKDVRAIDRFDVFWDGYSTYTSTNAHVNTIKIEVADSPDATNWTQVAFTDEIKDKDKDKVLEDSDQYHNTYHHRLPLSQTVKARYVRATFTIFQKVEITNFCVLGKEKPDMSGSTQKDLTVLSDNAKLTQGWYSENGYNLDYSKNTGADYMWTNDYTTKETTGMSDEISTFNATVPYGKNGPDLQDDGIGLGGNYSCNTLGTWGKATEVSVIWDLKNPKIVDRVDFIHIGNSSAYVLKKVTFYGKLKEGDEWTELKGFENIASNLWSGDRYITIFMLGGKACKYLRVDIKSSMQVNLDEMYIFGNEVPTLNSMMFTQDEVNEITEGFSVGEGITAIGRFNSGSGKLVLKHTQNDGTEIKSFEKTGKEASINLDRDYTKNMTAGDKLVLSAYVVSGGTDILCDEKTLTVEDGTAGEEEPLVLFEDRAETETGVIYSDDFESGKINATKHTGDDSIQCYLTDEAGHGKCLAVPQNDKGYKLKIQKNFKESVENSQIIYSFSVKPTSDVPIRIKVGDKTAGADDTDGLHLADMRSADGENPVNYLFGDWESGSKTAGLVKGEWNRVDAVVNQNSKAGQLWVNGKLIAQSTMPKECGDYTKIDGMTLIMCGGKEGVNLFDDIKVYSLKDGDFCVDSTYSMNGKFYLEFSSTINGESYQPSDVLLYDITGKNVSVTVKQTGSDEIEVTPTVAVENGGEYIVKLPKYLHDIAGRKIKDCDICVNAENNTGNPTISKFRLIDGEDGEELPKALLDKDFTGVKVCFDKDASNVSITANGESLQVDGSGNEYTAMLEEASKGNTNYTVVVSWHGGSKTFSFKNPEKCSISQTRATNEYLTETVRIDGVISNNATPGELPYFAVAAIYKDGVCVSVGEIQEGTVGYGESEVISVSAPRWSTGADYQVKLFCFNGTDNIKPIIKEVALSGEEPITPGYELSMLNELKEKYDKKNISDGFNIGLITDVQPSKLTGYQFYAHHYGSVVKASQMFDLDCIMDLGDVTNGGFTDKNALCAAMRGQSDILKEANLPTFRVPGNHDDNRAAVWNNGNNREYFLDRADWVESCDVNWKETMEGSTAGVKPYYYKDFENDKIRIIALDSCDVPDSGSSKYEYGFSSEQLEWLANEALDFSDKTDKEEWAVVFITHVIHDDAKGNYYNFTSFVDIISAFKKGESKFINQPSQPLNDSYKAKSPVVDINCNFKEQGPMEVICILTGDLHNDTKQVWNGIMDITTNCSLCNTSDASRFEYTDTEDAWDIVTIDRKEKLIYFTRFGHVKSNRVHEDRLFDYATNKQITINADGSWSR